MVDTGQLVGDTRRRATGSAAHGMLTDRMHRSDDIDWTFEGRWPYEPRYFDTPDGRLSYIDEGRRDARPVIMVHGNPTWAYLYRRFIRAVVAAGCRAIAMDHLGFGRSDKPMVPHLYRVPKHAERCGALLDALDLHDATLLVQDWGGPIGLDWASRNADRVRALAILNTFAHPPSDARLAPLPLKALRAPGIGEVMLLGLNAFTRLILFRAGLVHPERLDTIDRRAYLAPHPTMASRIGALVFPREIPDGSGGAIGDFLDALHDRLVARLRDRPMLIAWPMDDIAFRPSVLDDWWLADFPDAEVHRIESAGHYIQEDAHERVVPLLMDFLNR